VTFAKMSIAFAGVLPRSKLGAPERKRQHHEERRPERQMRVRLHSTR
jgi:hypothetical protein